MRIWLLVSLSCLAIASPSLAYSADSGATRFGIIAVDERKMLLFDGEEIFPEIGGNNWLNVDAVFPRGADDIVLVRNTGGSGCPALYHVIVVSAAEIWATSEIGSCSDYLKLSWYGDGLCLQMPRWEPQTYDLEEKPIVWDTYVVDVEERTISVLAPEQESPCPP